MTLHHLYDWFGANVALFHLINHFHAAWWDHLMLAMTWLGDRDRYPYYMAAILLVIALRPWWLETRSAAVFGVSYVLTALAVTALKPHLDFPRPLLALGKNVIMVGPPEFHHSFPSGHATFSVALAAALSAGVPRPAKWALWVFAALVCVSRVSVGAHFPADVLAGALLAAATVLVVAAAMRAVSARMP